MFTRDSYVALLEKRAEYGDVHSDPHSVSGAPTSTPGMDSAAATTQEHDRNKEDNRQYLHGIFPNAGAVQSNQTATIKQMFSNLPKDTITSNPLLKVARAVFFDALQQGDMLKTASPIHIELAYHAFCDELEKISMVNGR